MPTDQQVIDWIEQNTEKYLTDWQRQVVISVFSPDFTTATISMPKRNGRTSLVKSIEQAVTALRQP